MNISTLVLRLGCMVYFSLNAVGAPKPNVGMSGYQLVSENVCADVTLYIYYFCIQEIHGLVRYFMGESNGWFNNLEVLYKGGKRTFVFLPDEKYVVDEPNPVIYVLGPFRSVYNCILNRPKHMFAKSSAALVPNAVPLNWMKLWLSIAKLFNIRTFSRRQASVFAEGWI